MRTILVAATHRSGSYLACDWLSQLGGLPFPEEHFNFNLQTARQELRLSERADLSQVLDALILKRVAVHGVFTVKAMWPAFASIFAQFAQAEGDAADKFSAHAFKWLGRPQVLFIRRRDKVRQAVSFEIAKQTGVWRKQKGHHFKDTDLLYSYPRILACWNQIHEDEAAWLEFFREHRLSYHEIWYEDLVAEPNEQIHSALEFLAMAVKPGVRLESRFEKLSRGLNRDWANRFEARHGAKKKNRPDGEGSNPALASVRPVVPEIRIEPDAARLVDCELRNEGGTNWSPDLDPEGIGHYIVELRESAPPGGDVLWQAELEAELRPGEATTLSLRLDSGLRLDPFYCDLVFCYPGGEHVVPNALHVMIDLDEKLRLLREIFREIHASEMYGWIQIKDFGDMWIENFPFVYLHEHGWLNVDTENSSPGSFCAMDFELQYFAVKLEHPREFHVFQGEGEPFKCLEFFGVESDLRRFRDKQSGDLRTYPLSYQAGFDNSGAE